MSVSINRTLERSGQGELRDIYDATLFYAGTYETRGDAVVHRVLNASDPARIGRDQLRYAKLSDGGRMLELSSPPEPSLSGGRGLVRWRRKSVNGA
jgi:hypothetical protein